METVGTVLAYASQTRNRGLLKAGKMLDEAQKWLAGPLPSAPAKYRWVADIAMDDLPCHDIPCARAISPSALMITTTNGGARQ